ncbi:F-box protein At5g46170-like [Phragmites australis]|uniref:F-box protein At5g46170-like n=1 Tax=Phragmites australis TaxID=29695 RepID=UPI002D77E09E|nr:F-box protein At5g46170-like [Phragmites australis]XP_062231843.1 F-box protein At5g46170-like [Phragmites australis]XP_062231844.1 F-box protein At5g46170-like [Phragmites australis]
MAEDPVVSRRWSCDPGGDDRWLLGAAGNDHFDRLPDALLLVIFNRIGDVKALGRCSLVSRRFHELIPLVDSVLVRVDCVIPDEPPSSSSSPSAPSSPTASVRARGVFSQIARIVLGGIVKPIQALGQILSPANSAPVSSASSASSSTSSSLPPGDVSHHSPSEVLRSFKELRHLRIELPAGELGMNDGVMLKWKAYFGSTLGSCVILGASSASPSSVGSDGAGAGTAPAVDSGRGEPDDSGNIPESFYTNGGLKLRVVWTISSLIAAAARHYLLQPIIADHTTLESLDLTDADGQGVLTMDKWQLQELRMRPVSASGGSHRTLMPELSMQLWYAPCIELPVGLVLNGATLVAIKPSEEATRDTVGNGASGSAWVLDAFEEPYRTAVRMLLKRRTYSLEMNSF